MLLAHQQHADDLNALHAALTDLSLSPHDARCLDTIAQSLCLEFAAKGCRVFATSRRLGTMEMLQQQGIAILELDVTVPSSIQDAVASVLALAGRIDVLVRFTCMFFACSTHFISTLGQCMHLLMQFQQHAVYVVAMQTSHRLRCAYSAITLL